MIRERYIKEWVARHPWRRAEQVEQDLLLSRVLVAIYKDIPDGGASGDKDSCFVPAKEGERPI